jgi:DNA-3-methyladenine glycosylase II
LPRFLLTDRGIRRSLDALAAAHAPIAAALEQVGYPPQRRRDGGFPALARIVIGQQVSVAAATSIAARVEAALGGQWEAASLLKIDDDALRDAGLSRQKVRYLRALAAAVAAGDLQIDTLASVDDATVVEQITAITGFGVWSAHMYLMFSLGRPDVWPCGDLAVRHGFARLMGWDDRRPAEAAVRTAGEVFSPHRSALALLCWRYYSEAPL